MDQNGLEAIVSELKTLRTTRNLGRVSGVMTDGIRVIGLEKVARVGDRVVVKRNTGEDIDGEIVGLNDRNALVLPTSNPDGVALGDKVILCSAQKLFPCDAWLGRVVDPAGEPMDGKPLTKGPMGLPLMREPPSAVFRKTMGERLDTGMFVLNTLLPIVRGQRVGLFAGSGVGKTRLLGHLATHMKADVVVVALIGERGREVRDFVQTTLDTDGMNRTIVVAATSDNSALMRRQCAFTAMTIAEYFRDKGLSVLYLADSVTRLAEAHREVAVAAGEPPSLRGFPASMPTMITSLCERAGTGCEGTGDITAVFSVLVAASDMDEPVADTLRGVLDGHIVLDRAIAEGGRYPAINVVRSVSRSLPDAASDAENVQIAKARRLLAAYAKSETMIRAGLYSEGNDPILDQAVRTHEDFEALLSKKEIGGIDGSFQSLASLLRAADAYNHATSNRPRVLG